MAVITDYEQQQIDAANAAAHAREETGTGE